MRCCVSFCKNSKDNNNSEAITFHTFPSDAELKASWLKALGINKWIPRTFVCSDHFKPGDVYETKTGVKKIRPGVLPFYICFKKVDEIENITASQVCRICLGTDARLYPIPSYDLQQTYELLTGMMLYKDFLPQNLCMECIWRLQNCNTFRTKSLQAHTIMLDLVKNGNFTLEAIKSNQVNLKQNLSHKKFTPDHCDLYIVEEDTPTKPIQEIVFDDVKLEKDYINEDVETNFVVKNYSTDDSLPLETQRTKVKKVKKKREKKIKEPKIDRRRKPFLNDDLNESLFTITDLTFEEQVADIQKRQESSNFKNSVFKCLECFKGFLDEGAYNSHMTRHTNQCGEYSCEICKTHFKHSHALRKHTTAHHRQRFNCNRCAFLTTHRQTARLHERWHKGTKYECPHCNEVFLKFTTYMGHVRIKHPSDFVCALCGYCFVSQKGIDLHKKLKHRLHVGPVPEDGPLCAVCSVRFVSAEAYRRHLSVSARHHEQIPKDPTKPKRGRKFRDAEQETDADKTEADKKVYPSQVRKAEGPIQCEQCEMQLEDSRAYHAHFRRHHPDKNRTNYPSMKSPCMCEVCGRMFQSRALLEDHRWVHTNERPFPCDACGKRFRMKQRLVAHRRVHRPAAGRYHCALCGKAFSTHSNRQRHMIIHTGLKPFKCEMCGKCFKHASEKRAHITYVHLKKPWPKRARAKRQGQNIQTAPGASEMDIPWPDPKMDIMMDKQYFNIKI